MAANQPPWPRDWLMTDERMGERLWEAIGRVPAGTGGIVFRHYSLGPSERLELGKRVAALAQARKLALAVARDPLLAEHLGAQLVHNPLASSELPCSRSVHDDREARAAREEEADLVFVSPVFPTRSHPEAPALGGEQAARLAEMTGCPAIALGGMTFGKFWELSPAFHGWAGIDAWLEGGGPSRE
jgi:thiamine-phosphate pyrophosphorylase